MDATQAIQPSTVQEFVGNAHGDLARVTALLEEEPMLINAAWDWGGGDWETALGAASHMGRRDIALYLLERGARLDIFAAAMLGHLDIVTAIVRAHAGAARMHGPHGISLLAHAEAGGAQAGPVVEYLRTLEVHDNSSPIPAAPR